MSLAASLLLAQAAGVWHGVAHAVPPVGLGAAHARAAVAAPDTHDVWHHEAGDEQCRLLDQLSAPALTLEPASNAVTPAAPPRVAGAPTGIGRAEACAAYLARAPPRA